MALSPTVPTETEAFKAYLKEMLMDPEMSRIIHLYSDVDKKHDSQHHTLGSGVNQAKGNFNAP